MESRPAYATPRSFIAPLEGLRALAALGIACTHTAFQTGMPLDSVFARFDYFVPLFFALSGFLLWRRHVLTKSAGHSYYLHRAARILPAYLVLVVCVVLFLPAAFGLSTSQLLANFTLTQIYVPNGLAPGLTHLWSLCVEVAFYLALPVVGWLVARFGRHRVASIIGLAAVCMVWPFLPFVVSSPEPGVPNLQIFPFSYAPWFAVGLILAELEGRVVLRLGLWARLTCWGLALGVTWIAAQPWFGPLGLVHPTPWEFLARVAGGTVFAALLLTPYALAPAGRESAFLMHPVMQSLGRWSYGIFLWHLPALTWVFPILGIPVFSGHFVLVTLCTLLLTIPLAAASYEFVERPVARWVRKWDFGNARATKDTVAAIAVNH